MDLKNGTVGQIEKNRIKLIRVGLLNVVFIKGEEEPR